MESEYVNELLGRLKHLRLDVLNFPAFMLNDKKPQTLEECIEIWGSGFPNILFQTFEDISVQDTLDAVIKAIEMIINDQELECSMIESVAHAIDYIDGLLGQYNERYLYEHEVLTRSKDFIRCSLYYEIERC